jgi:hypothetical protein
LLSAAVIVWGDFSSLNLVYSVWKTNRDSLTEDCPPRRGGLNFITETHGIALKVRSTVKESFVHAVIDNFRRQSMPLLAVQRLFYKTAVDSLQTPGWISSQGYLPRRKSWPTDRSSSRKGLHQTGDPRREQ